MMSGESPEPPVVSIKLELSPNIFHFSDAQPPTLFLHLRTHSARPVTIQLGHGSPFDHRSSMQSGAFPIADLGTSPPTQLKIQDLTGRVNREPSPNKRYLTIPPEEVVTISVAFTRGGSYEPQFRPQPWEIVRKGRLLDEHGNETQARRSPVVCGCDGLEPGKKYRVTVATGKLTGRSWWWGTERDVQDHTAMTPTFESDDEQMRLPLDYQVEDDGLGFEVQE